jgi:hypothetical protein
MFLLLLRVMSPHLENQKKLKKLEKLKRVRHIFNFKKRHKIGKTQEHKQTFKMLST